MDGEQFNDDTGVIADGAPAMPPAIAAAIIAVKKQVKQLGHDERNQQGGYNSVSVDKMYANIGPVMADAGLALLIDETATEIRANEKTGNPWLFAHYDCRFVHESGVVSPAMRRSVAMPISGPQAFGAAQSYIEKQLLRQVFKVPTGERDADATAPQEDAPQGAAAVRQAQGSAPAARAAPQRPQAAPAPSAAKEAATARWKELRDLIDAAVELRDLEGIDGCQAWETCTKMIAEAEGDAGVAANAMRSLSDRLAKRHDMLTGGAVPHAGHDQYGSIDR